MADARRIQRRTYKLFDRRKVTFIDKEGQEHTFEVADGDNLLDIAQSEDLEMEGSGTRCALRYVLMSCRGMWWLLRLFDLSCHRRTKRYIR